MARTEELEARPAETPAPRRPEERDLAHERSAVVWWPVLVVVAAIMGLAVWVLSPRFEIDTPSLVDDWFSLSRSDEQVAEVVRFRNPETERFLPGAILWNYGQWHTFDAPGGLVGPNLWNLVRALVLVASLCVFTAVALPVRPGTWNAVLHAALAGIPAFAVVTVPKFARDMARFGPQEPWLVGGMALGGTLLVLAGRSLLKTSRPLSSWRTAALGVAGSAIWMLGVYHKETSLCAVPLVAAVFLVGWSRLRSWRLLSSGRKAALGALIAVAVLPIVHVAIESARIAARGDIIYEGEVAGGRSALSGLETLYDWAHEALPENARLLMWGALVLTAVAAVVRRRIDWIAWAALLSGVLSLAFAGQTGVVATRYYIPAYALFAVAFALSLARLPAPVQVAGVLCVVFAFTPVSLTRDEVQRWTDEELAGAAVVHGVAELERAGCTVALDGPDRETSTALPVLVRLVQSDASRPCAGAAAYLVLAPGEPRGALASACAQGALVKVAESPLVSLHRCDRLRTEPVRDPTFGLVAPARLVALRRFAVGTG